MSIEIKNESTSESVLSDSAGKKSDSETPDDDQTLALLLLHLAHAGGLLGTQKASLHVPSWRRIPVKVDTQANQPRQSTSRRTSLISMDTHYNASLVYHQHPGTASFPTPAPPYPSNPHEMSWQNHHSPPNSSSAQDHSMYSSMSRSQEHQDYDPQHSPSYMQTRHPQASPQHSYHARDSSRAMSFSEGGLGESRIFPRPMRRDSRLVDEGQVEAGPSSAPSDHYDVRYCRYCLFISLSLSKSSGVAKK